MKRKITFNKKQMRKELLAFTKKVLRKYHYNTKGINKKVIEWVDTISNNATEIKIKDNKVVIYYINEYCHFIEFSKKIISKEV